MNLIHYFPIATTLLAAGFFAALVRRYRQKSGGAHLLWWSVGAASYGLGTALESVITIVGNSVLLNKLWYVAGALLGGYPLAQGTVYLLLKRRTANLLTTFTLPLIALLSILVVFSPVIQEAMNPDKPSGAMLGWQFVRYFTPLINGYAAWFLIGGAVLSSWRFFRRGDSRDRAIGTALIAVGGLLPGIGGGMAKSGIVEGLYVGEFFGIILIWLGYARAVKGKPIEPAG